MPLPLVGLAVALLCCIQRWPRTARRKRGLLAAVALTTLLTLLLLALLDHWLLPSGLGQWCWLALIGSGLMSSRLADVLPGPRSGRAALCFVAAVVPLLLPLLPAVSSLHGPLPTTIWKGMAMSQLTLLVLLTLFADADARWAKSPPSAQSSRRLFRLAFVGIAVLALHAPSAWLPPLTLPLPSP